MLGILGCNGLNFPGQMSTQGPLESKVSFLFV